MMHSRRFRCNTAHLSTFTAYSKLFSGFWVAFLLKGKLLIFRLTPRGFLLPLLEPTRSSRISSRTF